MMKKDSEGPTSTPPVANLFEVTETKKKYFWGFFAPPSGQKPQKSLKYGLFWPAVAFQNPKLIFFKFPPIKTP